MGINSNKIMENRTRIVEKKYIGNQVEYEIYYPSHIPEWLFTYDNKKYSISPMKRVDESKGWLSNRLTDYPSKAKKLLLETFQDAIFVPHRIKYQKLKTRYKVCKKTVVNDSIKGYQTQRFDSVATGSVTETFFFTLKNVRYKAVRCLSYSGGSEVSRPTPKLSYTVTPEKNRDPISYEFLERLYDCAY